MTQALGRQVDESKAQLPPQVVKALRWMELCTVDERTAWREHATSHIEALAQRCISSGECVEWFSQAGDIVRNVAKDVNGPLLEILAKATEYHDVPCAFLFKDGSLLFGPLPSLVMAQLSLILLRCVLNLSALIVIKTTVNCSGR